MGYDVAIVGCGSYDYPTLLKAVESAVDAAGGLEWVKSGMKIAVKANLMMAKSADAAATVHPAFLRAVCELLTRRGASVVVGDSPGGPYADAYISHIYQATGASEIEKCGARLNRDFSVKTVKTPDAAVLEEFPATAYLVDADAVVNVCKLKTHGLMAYTGACKNFYGGVAGMVKSEFHYRYPSAERFSNMLVDLCEFFKPRLSVCDAVIGMQGNGPSAGEPRKIGAVLAAQNAHALDLVGAKLINLSADDVPTLAAAASRGLIPKTAQGLRVFGDIQAFTVSDFELCEKRDVRLWGTENPILAELLKGIFSSRPEIDKTRCVGCGECQKICPAKAAKVTGGKAGIERRKCVRCFCCQEFCPVGAISVKRPLTAKLLNRKAK